MTVTLQRGGALIGIKFVSDAARGYHPLDQRHLIGARARQDCIRLRLSELS
jgi:hypothetical protein